MGIKGKSVLELAAGLSDDQKNPLAGGKVYFYEAGTLTLKDIYLDRDKTIPASNPVILDIYGRAEIFGDGLYKLIVKDANDVIIWDMDNVDIIPLDGGDLNSIDIGQTTPGKGKFTLLEFITSLKDPAGNTITDFHNLKNFIDSINKDNGEVFKTVEASFNTWVTGTSYTAGDKVKVLIDVDLGVYKVYEANATHTAGATFVGDADKWDQDTVNSSPYINDPVYFDTSSNKWKLSDLLTTNTPEGIVSSLVNTSSTVRTALICFKGLMITNGVAAGSKYYLQEHGGLDTNPTTWFIFKGISTTQVLIDIRYVQSASSTGNAQAINTIETQLFTEKYTRMTINDSQHNVVKESFVESYSNRLASDATVTINQDKANVSLNTSQTEGYVYDSMLITEEKLLEKLNYSFRQNTNTVFDVSTGNSTTQTVLTSSINRSGEFKQDDVVWFIPMRRLKATTTTTKWIQSGDSTYRVTLSADGTGTGDITLNHSALPIQLPAYDDDQFKYVCFIEHVSAAYKKESNASTALGSYTKASPNGYTAIIPQYARILEYGIPYNPYIHSHWKLNEAAGGTAINSKQLSGTYNLTQVGTVPSTAGKFNLARGPFTAANYFMWSAGGSSATVYDTATFIVDGWFKTSVTGATQYIISKTNDASGVSGWAVQIKAADNKLRFNINNGSGVNFVDSSSTYTDGNWHYFRAVIRATSGANEMRLYVDGSLAGQSSGVLLVPQTYDLMVGAVKSGSSVVNQFQGLLDSICYFNTVSSWVEEEALSTLRYGGGSGREYGSDIGQILYGSIDGMTCEVGDRYSFATGLVRNSGLLNTPTLEHYGWKL